MWALVPPSVVTVTAVVSAASAGGATTVICVSESTVKSNHVTSPKATEVAPVKPVPVIVTAVPPATGPEVGERSVTVGSATNVN